MILSDSSFIDSFDHQRACCTLPLPPSQLIIDKYQEKEVRAHANSHITSRGQKKKNALKPAKNERFTPPNNRDGHLDKLIKGV